MVVALSTIRPSTFCSHVASESSRSPGDISPWVLTSSHLGFNTVTWVLMFSQLGFIVQSPGFLMFSQLGFIVKSPGF